MPASHRGTAGDPRKAVLPAQVLVDLRQVAVELALSARPRPSKLARTRAVAAQSCHPSEIRARGKTTPKGGVVAVPRLETICSGQTTPVDTWRQSRCYHL